MIVNVNYQLPKFQTHLEDKPLGMFMIGYLYWIIELGRLTLNTCGTILWVGVLEGIKPSKPDDHEHLCLCFLTMEKA